MNGVRSIFRRKGYLLTALAAAVLLAASSGTAWAQTLTGFSAATAEVDEGDTVDVTVTRSGDNEAFVAKYGEITLAEPTGLTIAVAATTPGGTYDSNGLLTFTPDDSNKITLTITAVADVPQNWVSEQRLLTLVSAEGQSIGNATLRVTVNDPAPVAKFSRDSITLNDGTNATVTMSVEPVDSITDVINEDEITVKVVPANALDADALDDDRRIITVTVGGTDTPPVDPDEMGLFSFPIDDLDAEDVGVNLNITADGDLADNTIPKVTFSFVPLSATLNGTDALGEIVGENSLTINLPSVGTTTTKAGDIGIKSVKVDAANSDNKVNEGTSTMVTVTLTEDWTAATAAKITLEIGVASGGKGGLKGEAELVAMGGEPADLLLGSETLAVNKDQDEVSIALLVNDDLDAVGEKFVITATLDAVDDVTDAGKLTGNFSGSIVDDEMQTYEFEVKTDDDEIVEDDNFDVTLKAKPNRPANEDVTFFLKAPKDYVVPKDSVSLTATEALLDITVKTPKNDGNRTDDVITLSAVTGSAVSNKTIATSESITVLDIHQLPTDITGEANGADEDGKETDAVVTMVAEGGKAFLYVTVVNEKGDGDRISDDEDFTVRPTLSGSQVLDARIMPTDMKISDGEESGDETVVGPFTIEAVNDEDIGMETLMVSLDVTGGGKDASGKAYGSGTSSGTFSINIEDGTEPLVFVEDGAYEAIMAALGGAVTQGATVTIMTGDLFGTAEGYTASFGAAVEGNTISASASGESFTLTASEDMTGESKVTVTATARMMGSSFIPSQTVSNVAEIVFPVMVEAVEPVPALPLIGQLLLALFMMAGGARLYRRRQG